VLATITTHDLPPTAGYLTGEHIRVRSELGLLTRSVEEEHEIDAHDQRAYVELLISLGLLSPEQRADEQTLVEALHRLLAGTPARLIGIQLADAVGDRRAVNQPGTSEEYPNWRVPLADVAGRPVLLEDLLVAPRARALAAAVSG
jgi:4-alpha-glucanotransferase